MTQNERILKLAQNALAGVAECQSDREGMTALMLAAAVFWKAGAFPNGFELVAEGSLTCAKLQLLNTQGDEIAAVHVRGERGR